MVFLADEKGRSRDGKGCAQRVADEAARHDLLSHGRAAASRAAVGGAFAGGRGQDFALVRRLLSLAQDARPSRDLDGMAEQPRRARRHLGRLLALRVEDAHRRARPFPFISPPIRSCSRPTRPPWKPEWSDRAAFVGTIPSLKSLEAMSAHFPRALDRLLEETCAAMQAAPWPIRPYDLARAAQSFLGSKYGLAIDAALRTPEIQAYWHLVLWRWGKRIARLRGLAAVGQGAPAGDHERPRHGGLRGRGGTARGAAGRRFRLRGHARAFRPARGRSLFRTGKFQVQITDPQSVEGGLPFRVFECAACGVPLLSDHRARTGRAFPRAVRHHDRSERGRPGRGRRETARDPGQGRCTPRAANCAKPFSTTIRGRCAGTRLAQRPQNLAYVASLATVSWTPSRRYVEEIVPQAA